MSSKGASGTTTSTGSTTPWTEQQPYLKDIMSESLKLYQDPSHPLYYPDSTYAPLSKTGTDALGDTAWRADENLSNPNSLTNTATTAENKILAGDSLTNNLGYLKLADLQKTSPLATGSGATGTNTLEGLAGTNPATGSGGYNTLSELSTSDAATNNIAGDTLASNAGTNFGTTKANEGAGYLKGIAAGDLVKKGNPYTKELSDSVLASVVPDIESQFISGGTLASPETVRATTAGAAAGLAPSLFKDYDTQTTNQIDAAKDISSSFLKGAEDTTTAANNYGNLALGGIGYKTTAANDLLSGYLTGSGQQLSAGSDLGDQAIKGYSAQTTAANDTSGAYNTGIDQILSGLKNATDINQLPYTDLTQKYTAATLQQKEDQNALDESVSRWNYNETLPYDKLNELIGAVTGNYGGSTTLTQPFFDNTATDAVGTGVTALGGLKLLSGLLV